MGGPCILDGEEGQRTAPACTDNFQVRPFHFDGKEWQSVEQCFQGMKFVDLEARERVRAIKKQSDLSDAGHGLLVWQAGQCEAAMRPDWEATKVDIMYRINFAKYAQHPDLQAELHATGHAEIIGGPSTAWTTKSGTEVNWSEWNGRVQMLTRELLRPTPERRPVLVDSLLATFRGYMADQGGALAPLPGGCDCPAGEFSAEAAKRWLESCANGDCINDRGLHWQAWVGDDVRLVVASLLICGLDDAKFSVLVAGTLQQLLRIELGISVKILDECLAEYSEEVLEDIALDNPRAIQMVSTVRAAVADKRSA